ncbi:MAG: 50S ribosomal protein L9 [candidate division SR1 bacterium]|nr:50S ribosomal protein L9 [candidate division SR1 bacterium]
MPRRKLENKTIEVILLQSDKHLGEKFEIVRVKPIFARNVLLPKNIAVLADADSKNKFAQKMVAAEVDRKKKASGLDDLFTKLHHDGGITIIRKANADGTLYAKVDENDIATVINTVYGTDIEPHYLKLKKKITAVGSFSVPFLYKELKKDVAVKVDQDPEEAEKIAKHKASKHAKKNDEEVVEEGQVKKTKAEVLAEKEVAKQAKRAETIKRLKEKFKD